MSNYSSPKLSSVDLSEKRFFVEMKDEATQAKFTQDEDDSDLDDESDDDKEKDDSDS